MFLGGGPITSTENALNAMEKTIERALDAAVGGLQTLNAVRGGTNPQPEQSGFYDSSDEYTAYEVYGDPIGVNPLGP